MNTPKFKIGQEVAFWAEAWKCYFLARITAVDMQAAGYANKYSIEWLHPIPGKYKKNGYTEYELDGLSAKMMNTIAERNNLYLTLLTTQLSLINSLQTI